MKKQHPPFPVIVSQQWPPHSERNLYLSSWRHSLRDSPAGEMPERAYKLYFDEISQHYLGPVEGRIELPDDCVMLTLRKADRPSYVAGWCLLDRTLAHVTCIVHAYVKRDLRCCGYGSLLLRTALDVSGDDQLGHAFILRDWVRDRAADYGVEHVPIQTLMRAQQGDRGAA